MSEWLSQTNFPQQNNIFAASEELHGEFHCFGTLTNPKIAKVDTSNYICNSINIDIWVNAHSYALMHTYN